jgi:hypothetical protein
LAACDQHRHDDRHVFDGFSDSEHPESRFKSDSFKAGGIDQSVRAARNSVIDLDSLSDEQLKRLEDEYKKALL